MGVPKKITKRSGSIQLFNQDKIFNSICIAATNVGKFEKELVEDLFKQVMEYVDKTYSKSSIISTYDIGSAVERILVDQGQYEIVKEFIISRERKKEEHKRRMDLGVEDDIGYLDYNALFILKERYLKTNLNGMPAETPMGMLKRVAKFVASAEKSNVRRKWEKEFLNIMTEWKFLPGTRVLANAGKDNPQLANCFVFEINDSIDDIFKTLYESSLTKKYGGGCGYNFSKIRPKGDYVAGQIGLAAGPIEIMKMFDLPTSIFRQQGKYESGNMAILNVNHPDILEFITAKEKDGILPKTNISIGITDDFMNAVKKDHDWKLINPRTKEVTNTIKARAIWELAITYAHRTGDPGIIFLDKINNNNPCKNTFGPIQATNPCGEIPQYPYESCNLGYLNLTHFIKDNKIDYTELQRVCDIAIRFMDNVIDKSWFPVEKQNETIRGFRRIGIGVVGWADVLTELAIPYGSKQSIKLAEELSKRIADYCHEASVKLGAEKGPFPFIKYSTWAKNKKKPRNITTNTLPPSSGNAVIFGTSYSIEPYFALAYYQNILGGIRIENINKNLEKMLLQEGIKIENLFVKIFENHGSIQNIKEIPDRIKKLFLTAHDIPWDKHLAMQAAWQKNIDNAITKTINLPSDAGIDIVEKVYMKAWESGCKGITIYRDNSKSQQVIEFGNNTVDKNKEVNVRKLKGGDKCPECGATLISIEGCVKCVSCSFSLCQL